MICKVKAAIEKYGLITDKTITVAVGFSGGADSVCLLHILSRLKAEYGIIIKAVHVNHNIRGDEALRDEGFVRDFCRRLDIELDVYSIDVPSLAKEKKLSLEECGRVVRYECFRKSGCDAIAVAHTLSDSIETMLFNLARGTGTKGLAGISPKREPDIIRPLINCTRAEIESYCKENSLCFVTDSTNLTDDYTRNHIRHKLVPQFEKINVCFESAFSRAMEGLSEENDFIEKSAESLLLESKCSEGYKIDVFSQAHSAVLKRAVMIMLKPEMSKPPEAKHIDACFDIIKQGKGKIELGKDLYILADGDIISFHRGKKTEKEWKSFFEDGVAQTPYGSFILSVDEEQSINSFDRDKIKGELFLSSRLPGDSFTFSKRKISKSLKKLFNEMKIPKEKRNAVAVLHDDEDVVWIEDIGVNHKYIPDENTQKIIAIKKDGEIC